MSKREKISGSIDWVTVTIYIILVTLGWFSVFTASAGEDVTNLFDLSTRYGKQILWIGLAVVLALIILVIDAKFFSTFSFVFYFGMLILLIAVLLFGSVVAGSKSWFKIGGFAIQPAEFAKFATALAMAKYLSILNIDMRRLKTKLISLTILAVPALLILLQNDTGSALVYFSFVIVLFREGFSGLLLIVGIIMTLLFLVTLLISELYVIAALVVLAFLILIFIRSVRRHWKAVMGILVLSTAFVYSVNYSFENVLEPHQKKRINVLLGLEEDLRGAGYNVNQSKIAIGSGGLAGKGFRQGVLTRYNFVPEQSTDFIFCTVGEEWGFIGVTTVILLFLALLIRIVLLAERQRSKFSRIYGYGVASILFFHFAINIGMTVGLAPVVGIPLPFFSYGGSSLWAFTILLFIFIKQDAKRLNVL
ncbi:MAG TPA: rod shape-determining protein RodA [Bacteroidales bacterium]|nr:rod shape-determining protein RodA [Bacteroidales bacterium]